MVAMVLDTPVLFHPDGDINRFLQKNARFGKPANDNDCEHRLGATIDQGSNAWFPGSINNQRTAAGSDHER